MNAGILDLPKQTVKMPRPLLGRAASSPFPLTYGWRADPYWQNVCLLLKFDGQSGSKQYTDWSQYGHKFTPTGNVNISESQTVFGETSGFFRGDGTSGISTPDHSAFALGSSNFTIEAWIYPTNTAGVNTICGQRNDAAENQLAFVFYQLSGKTHMVVSSNGTSWAINQTGSLNVTANAWSHVAMVRNGSQWRIYLNGQVAQTSTSSMAVFDSTAPMWVGHSLLSSNQDFSGHISELRITNGIARYTAAFNPVREPFPTC